LPIRQLKAEIDPVHSNLHNIDQREAGCVGTKTKRVLAIGYSQTGQLTRIAERILAPLQQAANVEVRVETLRTLQPYPFPWTLFSFLDAFPESVHLVAPALEPLSLNGDEDFDLVILAYQVWFLAPSLPVTAFLKSPLAKRLLNGKPVVTVIACRNMWMMAQEKMKLLLSQCGARLIDNVVLTDPSATLVTLVTTPYWLLTGKKRLLGFAPAGIDTGSIARAERFGCALREGLQNNAERRSCPMLHGLMACVADPRLYLSERAGTRSFYWWGKLLCAAGEPGSFWRKPLLVLYVIFLIMLVLSVVPLSLAVQAVLRPLLTSQMMELKQQFEMPSGSGQERMDMYEY
jgi:hypothetical protein